MNKTTSRMDQYLDNCRDLIARHGHLVQYVGGSPYGFAYSAGLTPVIGCELITIGLPCETAQYLLNGLAKRLQESPIADGDPIEELANMPLKLCTHPLVDPRTGVDRNELVAVAGRLGYRSRYVRQLLWPDKAGRFPTDTGYAHGVVQDIDLLLRGVGVH